MRRAFAIATAMALSAGVSHATVVRNYTVVTASSPFGATDRNDELAECPSGTSVIGGGADVVVAGGATPYLVANFPRSDASGWSASAVDLAETGGWRLVATAICGTVPGLEAALTTENNTDALHIFGFVVCPGGKRPVSGGMTTVGVAPSRLDRVIWRSAPVVGYDDVWGGVARRLEAGEWAAGTTTVCIEPDDDVEWFSVSSTTGATAAKQVSVVCPEGRSVLGGSADIADPLDSGALTANGPAFVGGEIVGWRAAAEVLAPSPTNWRLDVAVACPETAHAAIAWLALAALHAARARRH